MALVDVRCPETGRMFGRIAVETDAADVSFEVACRNCRRNVAAAGRTVALVLHLYDGKGLCIDTIIVDDQRT